MHVGRQFEGVNAFERAVPAMARLIEIKKEVELRETGYNITPAAARRSILLLGGRAEAGTNFNATPEFCSFTIDRRLNPEEDLEEEKRRLLDALDGFEIEMLQEEPAAGTPAGDPLGVILSRHIATLTGREPVFEMCPGLLETRFYAAYGIPAFSYGPGLLTVSHGPNEFVPIHNIVRCAEIYALTAAGMLAGSTLHPCGLQTEPTAALGFTRHTRIQLAAVHVMCGYWKLRALRIEMMAGSRITDAKPTCGE
jgi:acetylornithine deacetylase/succinyl-diaminopimelate desuccinylase-like protein